MASVQLQSLICQFFQIVVMAQTALFCVFISTTFGPNTETLVFATTSQPILCSTQAPL